DMVGRLGDGPLIVYGTGTAREWESVLDELGSAVGVEMSYQPEGYGPSDHTSFYTRDVPVLHFFTNTHEDYHKPSDDWDRIDVAGLEKVSTLVTQTARRIADAPQRLALVRGVGRPRQQATEGQARGSGAWLGTVPDYAAAERGVRIGGVTPGSPAETAGMKGGDILIGMAGREIADLQAMFEVLSSQKPGDTIELVVLRDGTEVRLQATLGTRANRGSCPGLDGGRIRPAASIAAGRFSMLRAGPGGGADRARIPTERRALDPDRRRRNGECLQCQPLPGLLQELGQRFDDATAQDDDLRVERVRDRAQPGDERVLDLPDQRTSQRVARLHGSRECGCRDRGRVAARRLHECAARERPRDDGVIRPPRNRPAARVRLQAAPPPAPAPRAVQRHDGMAQLARSPGLSAKQLTVRDDAATDARADEHADGLGRPAGGAIGPLAVRCGLHVVQHGDPVAGAVVHDVAQGVVMPAQVRRVLDHAARAVDLPGHADPPARHRRRSRSSEHPDHQRNRLCDGVSAALRQRRSPLARQDMAVPVDEDAGHLRAAQVDADGVVPILHCHVSA